MGDDTKMTYDENEPTRNCDHCDRTDTITKTDENGDEKCIFCQIKDDELPEPPELTKYGEINRLHPDNPNVTPENVQF